jgi:hypothetical protein
MGDTSKVVANTLKPAKKCTKKNFFATNTDDEQTFAANVL